MTALADVLGMCRVIVDLPEAEADDLVAAGEVWLQERLNVWSLPVARCDELATLAAVFSHRAVLAVHDVRTPEQAVRACAAGAALLFSPFADTALLAAAGDVPVVLGGLTPSEIAAALAAEPAGVQAIPCDVLGSLYARTLPALFPGAALVATGRMERFQAEMWLDAGALAVFPLGTFTADDVSESDLGDLRRRCRQYDVSDL